MNYKFVLVDAASGSDSSTQWTRSLPVTVGRCPTAEITLDEVSISRKHCQFYLDPYGSLVVRDLGSKNGIYVDGRRVEKATVRPGTEVQIGLITIRPELTEEDIVDDSKNDDVVYDLAETEPVKIIRPDDQPDRFDIG